MGNSPSFQYYPADFLTDPEVMLWDMETIGCYWILINYLWLNQGAAEVSPEFFCVLFKVKRRKKALLMWKKIELKFTLEDGKITHKRVAKEMQKQREWRLKSSIGGKKSAKNRARVVEKCLQPNGNSSTSNSNQREYERNINIKSGDSLSLKDADRLGGDAFLNKLSRMIPAKRADGEWLWSDSTLKTFTHIFLKHFRDAGPDWILREQEILAIAQFATGATDAQAAFVGQIQKKWPDVWAKRL